jgi:hypothetical protein
MTQFGYTIFGGHADADRLAHQAAAMARATSAFLTPRGAPVGQVTIHLARAVGPAAERRHRRI